MKAVLMAIATKLLGAYALSQSAAHTQAAVQRFLAGLALVLVMALVCGVLLGSVLIGAHVLLYVALTTVAMLSPLAALSITLGVAVLLTVGVVVTTATKAKVIFDMPAKMSFAQEAEHSVEQVGQKISGIADAFMDGLKHGSASRRG